MLPIKITPKIFYNNKDISSDLKNFLTDVSYNDPLSNQADDLSLSVDNCLKLWNNEWLPEKGATLKASFIYTNVKSKFYLYVKRSGYGISNRTIRDR